MQLNQFVKAMQRQALAEKLAKPENYVNYQEFDTCVPDLFSEGRRSPMMPEFNQRVQTMAAVMAGNRVSDEEMQRLFGFNNAELDAAMQAASPFKKPLPAKLVLMTFDDSTLDHYTIVAPTLEKFGGKANLFTTEMRNNPMPGGTDFDDKSNHMTWEQIRELYDRGHEICNHSHHHDINFTEAPMDQVRAEIEGLEEQCARYGIRKPTVMGYPGGPATMEVARMLRSMGYKWGRGDCMDSKPVKTKWCAYDPMLHSPMYVPGKMITSKESLHAALDETEQGKVLLEVFHTVNDPHDPFAYASFEQQVADIYEYGGRCITFTELEEYIDPDKAYAAVVE